MLSPYLLYLWLSPFSFTSTQACGFFSKKNFLTPRFCDIKNPGSDPGIINCSFKEENQEGKISNTYKLKSEKYKMVRSGICPNGYEKSRAEAVWGQPLFFECGVVVGKARE